MSAVIGPGGLPLASGAVPDLAINDTDSKLIWELVAEISKPSEILARYSITPQQFAEKQRNRMWVAAYREAKKLWKSDLNVQQRIKLKSALLLEDSLIQIAKIISTPEMSAAVKLDAAEVLGKLSDSWEPGKKQGVQQMAQNVTININGMPVKGVRVVGETYDAES